VNYSNLENIKIMKFGGAALAKPHGLENMSELLSQKNGNKILAVFSALGKSSAILLRSAESAEAGNLSLANDILNSHFDDLLISSLNYINQEFHELLKSEFNDLVAEVAKILKGIDLTKELTPKVKDKILAFGEIITMAIICKALESKGLNYTYIDSRRLIVTNSNYNNAEPLINPTTSKAIPVLNNAFEKHNLVITQGFVAEDEKGATTTMGFESSNLTALVLAELLSTKELTIWTDVEGIMTADPAVFANTRKYDYLNYEFAKFTAQNGLKLVYPSMIDFAQRNNVIIQYRNLLNLNDSGTIISDSPTSSMPMTIYNDSLYIDFYAETSKSEYFSLSLPEGKIALSKSKSHNSQPCILLIVLNIDEHDSQSFKNRFVDSMMFNLYDNINRRAIYILKRQ